MLGTGNDIVAISAINVERTRQASFYSKILSSSEQQLYIGLQPQLLFENFVWLAWSVKESAFKFLQKFTPDLVFSPTKVIITKIEKGRDVGSVYNGIVQFNNYLLYFRSIIDKDYIFSVVNFDDNFTRTRWGIKQVASSESAYQSHAVREFLLAKLDSLFPGDDLKIDKNPHGWPVVLKNGREIPLPVSLAHHGHYVAYSFQLK